MTNSRVVHTDLTLDPGSLVRWALESLVCGCFLLLYISNKALLAPDLCQVRYRELER